MLALAPIHGMCVGSAWGTRASVYKGNSMADLVDLFRHGAGKIMVPCQLSSTVDPREVSISGQRAEFMTSLLGRRPTGWEALVVDCMDLGRLAAFPSPWVGRVVPTKLTLVAWSGDGDLDTTFVGKLAQNVATACHIPNYQGFTCFSDDDFIAPFTGQASAARVWVYLSYALEDWEALVKPVRGALEVIQARVNTTTISKEPSPSKEAAAAPAEEAEDAAEAVK